MRNSAAIYPTISKNTFFWILFIFLNLLALPLSALQPTDEEQYMLEMINRARANPVAEVTRLSKQTWGNTGSPATPDLNEGLTGSIISDAPKPALAFNEAMIQASSSYADTLLTNDAFTHTYNGTSIGTRLRAAGYDYQNKPGAAEAWENIALTLTTYPVPLSATAVERQHDQLMIDNNVGGRGHRRNLMNPNLTSIGIGIGQDNSYDYGGRSYSATMSVQNFSFRNEDFFLTGVAYTDHDNDRFYTPGGEGLGNYLVEAYTETGQLINSTTTFQSGGYSMQLPEGNYTLHIEGSGVDEWTPGVAFSNQENLKFDFIDPGFIAVPEPSSLFLLVLSCSFCLIRKRR